MERRIKLGIIFFLFSGSFIFSQSLMNRLRVPITINGKIGIGYDNNILRFSKEDINCQSPDICPDLNKQGITSTLDSPIIKPMLKLKYSPVIIDGKTTNIVSSVSYSHFTHAMQKSYFITNLSLEIKLRSYSWVKLGHRYLPEYYLRDYIDRDMEPGKWKEYSYGDSFVDTTGISFGSCSSKSQKYFISYSFPLQWIKRTGVKLYSDFTQEYYRDPKNNGDPFTEFDIDKYMVQIELNHRMKKKHRIKLAVSTGFADNITYAASLQKELVDRSYVFDKIRGEIVINHRRLRTIKATGLSIQLEQRLYDNIYQPKQIIDYDWKYYLDGRAKVWCNWNIIGDIEIKTWYQYRWRDVYTPPYSDVEWVEDVKSYSKHEFWLEFSYKFITDILY